MYLPRDILVVLAALILPSCSATIGLDELRELARRVNRDIFLDSTNPLSDDLASMEAVMNGRKHHLFPACIQQFTVVPRLTGGWDGLLRWYPQLQVPSTKYNSSASASVYRPSVDDVSLNDDVLGRIFLPYLINRYHVVRLVCRQWCRIMDRCWARIDGPTRLLLTDPYLYPEAFRALCFQLLLTDAGYVVRMAAAHRPTFEAIRKISDSRFWAAHKFMPVFQELKTLFDDPNLPRDVKALIEFRKEWGRKLKKERPSIMLISSVSAILGMLFDSFFYYSFI